MVVVVAARGPDEFTHASNKVHTMKSRAQAEEEGSERWGWGAKLT